MECLKEDENESRVSRKWWVMKLGGNKNRERFRLEKNFEKSDEKHIFLDKYASI